MYIYRAGAVFAYMDHKYIHDVIARTYTKAVVGRSRELSIEYAI